MHTNHGEHLPHQQIHFAKTKQRIVFYSEMVVGCAHTWLSAHACYYVMFQGSALHIIGSVPCFFFQKLPIISCAIIVVVFGRFLQENQPRTSIAGELSRHDLSPKLTS